MTGYADLEKQKSSKHVQNTLKLIFKALETKKKFEFFCPIPYTWHLETDLPTTKTKSPQNSSKTLLKSFLLHKKQKKNFRFFSPHTLHMDPHLSSTPTPKP